MESDDTGHLEQDAGLSGERRPRPRNDWLALLARRLSTENPFYAISCGLVMYGLFRSFTGGALADNAWTLMGMLAGYTLLLAVTAYLLIRFARVWDDARTILLLVVLLFMGTSISFDELLFPDPAAGRALLVTGLGMAVLVSEGLLVGLGVRLPAGYRVPYHLMLALFFTYPLWIVSVDVVADPLGVAWRVLAFGVLAAGILLMLLPAAARGAASVADNGTPWPWPLFPWSLFVVLAAGVGLRTWSLSISFVPANEMETPFGAYFLVPLLLAVSVLLVEGGRTSRWPAVGQAALLLPVLGLWLAVPRAEADPVYEVFLADVVRRVGSPVFLGLVGAGAVYGWAAWRDVPLAHVGLALCLALATVVTPQTVDATTLAERAQWLPAAAAAVLEIVRAWQRRTAWRMFLAATFSALALAVPAWGSAWLMPAAWLSAHVWLTLLVAIACLHHDSFARVLRVATMAALVLLGMAAGDLPAAFWAAGPPWNATVYVLLLAVVAGAAAWRTHSAGYLAAAAVLLLRDAVLGWRGLYGVLAGTVLAPGLNLFAWGLLFFGVAVLCSLWKASVLQGVVKRIRLAWQGADGEAPA